MLSYVWKICLHIWIIYSSVQYCCEMLFCDSVEEKANAILQFPENTSQNDSFVYKNNEKVCICYMKQKKCDLFDKYKNNTICSVDNTNLTVTLKNVMRSTNNDTSQCWATRKNSKQLCCFQIVSKAENMTCVSRSEENIHVSCSATKVFPKAICMFTISNSSTQISHMIENASNSMFSPEDSTNDIFYYNASCEIYHNITLETVGNYSIIVSIYPNIENNSKLIHETNRTLNILFEKPSIQFSNCLASVVAHVIVSCSCQMKGLGSASATYNWFNNHSKTLLTNESLLTFVATKYDTAFLCEARSDTLNVTITNVYNITIITEMGNYVSIIIVIIAIIIIFFSTVLLSRYGNCRSRNLSTYFTLTEEKFLELIYVTEDFDNEDVYVLKTNVTKKLPGPNVSCLSLSTTEIEKVVSLKLRRNEDTYTRISYTETTIDGKESTCGRFQLKSLAFDIKSDSAQSSTNVSESQGVYSFAQVKQEINVYECIT
uniref:Uncharacterized protein LOC106058306 isoform X2 n=1 Tax=Biomphalaria glabrata TaxID=6526 RepID=A0A9W2YTD5_BIOGL|nr:uncharacterized protein LOC106058306 isoform X2 [Biomphalaria glabrata]